MMYDIVALGESLIDFTPAGKNALGMSLFARNPGGAPANALAMAARLGGKTAFVGKVGDDDFGRFLIAAVAAAGVDVSGMVRTREAPTTLAFVQLDEKGDRSFSFYRSPGADICLRPDEVSRELLENCRIFHFGSVSLTDEPSRSATLESARTAKRAGALVSFDPNYRAPLWGEDERRARREMLAALPLADLVKVSEEEMTLLTGETDLRAGAEKLAAHGAVLAAVTLGPGGSFYRTERACGLVPARRVDAVDTTGAGDAFWGALLSRAAGKTREELAALSAGEWERLFAFANAAGTLTATKTGAIPAMPTLREVEAFARG